MGVLDKFKRDLSKYRGKAAVLGILFVTMAAMTVRAIVQMRPHTALANSAIQAASTTTKPSDGTAPTVNTAARLQESRNLWDRLKEVKASATEAKTAFTFDPSYYAPPAPVEMTPSDTAEVKPLPAATVDDSAIRVARIREQVRGLVVKSTAAGNGTMEPMAIINQQLLTAGQKIMGFEITAIRAREVEFAKDGVTTVVRMPEGQ
jgi:hypothetical protein